MKKISLAIALLIIIGVVAYALLPGGSNETAVASAQVTVLERTVVTGKDKSNVEEIQGDTVTVETGSYLKTGEKGRALVELGKAETVVDYNSEVVIEDVSADGSTLKLFIGATWSRVEKLFDKGEYHEIKTKNAVASVRGTYFGVYYDQKTETTRLIVATGTVAFTAIDESGNIIATSTVYVYEGEEASRTGTGLIIKKPSSEATKKEMSAPAPTPNKPHVQSQTTPQTTPSPTITQAPASAPAPAPVSNSSPVDNDYYLKIHSVDPTSVVEESGELVTIRGIGFSHATALKIGDDQVNYRRVSDEKITFTLPDHIDDGSYRLTIRGEGGRTFEYKGTFTVVKPTTQNDQNYQYDPNGVQ